MAPSKLSFDLQDVEEADSHKPNEGTVPRVLEAGKIGNPHVALQIFSPDDGKGMIKAMVNGDTPGLIVEPL